MAANIRFIFDNAGDRGTLTASSTAGSLAATNLQSDERAAVWRSAAAVTTATLTLNWAAAEIIDSVVLAWTNFTALATARVRGYALAADTATVVDETVTLDAALALDAIRWGVDPLVQSGASRAGVAEQAMVWLASPVAVRKLVIDIADAQNTATYLEASRLIAGVRFEPAYNMSYGLQVDLIDRAQPARAESGDLRVEPLTQHRGLSLNLDWLRTAADRNAPARMAQRGRGRGVWVSCFPDRADTSDQQFGSFYGALMDKPGLGHNHFSNWRAPLQFEEMS